MYLLRIKRNPNPNRLRAHFLLVEQKTIMIIEYVPYSYFLYIYSKTWPINLLVDATSAIIRKLTIRNKICPIYDNMAYILNSHFVLRPS
jgi:hypothetical protein